MPQIVRYNDIDNHGHPELTFSPNVYVNGKPIIREGDSFTCSTTKSNGTSIYINNIRCTLYGDGMVGNNHLIQKGSPDTFGGR